VGVHFRVRAGPRGGKIEDAHAPRPRALLRQPVERVRYSEVGTVRSRVSVLGRGRGPNSLGGRRTRPQVLALGRSAVGSRGPVRRSYRHGVLTAVVPVPAELLRRSHAGVAWKNVARLRQVRHVPGHHHGGVHLRSRHAVWILCGHGAQGPGDGPDNQTGVLVRHRGRHIQNAVLGYILHDSAGGPQRDRRK